MIGMSRILSITQKGNFAKTDSFLHRLKEWNTRRLLDSYGKKGVEALRAATPRDTGKTAESWSYVIEEEPGRTSLYWKNSNINKGVMIAVIIQYGHGTRNGGYVQGIDYINPALQPIFDEMAERVWKEVTSS